MSFWRHIARGLSPEDARRAARLELGSATAITDRLREHGWEHVVGTALTDLRYGARRLRPAPGFTAVTILTVAIGAVVGLIGAIAASEAIATLLFGVSRLDPLTYVTVIALLLGVSATACWVPAWRAARVDPAVTLRAE